MKVRFFFILTRNYYPDNVKLFLSSAGLMDEE